MNNVSIPKFSWSQMNSVLICSIRVSNKSFILQQKDWIAQLFAAIFDFEFWFSDSSKTCSWYCKIISFKLFFLRNYQPESSIGFPMESFLLVVQLGKMNLFRAESKTKLAESDQKFQLFDSCQNSNLFLSIKKGRFYSNKIHIENSRL